MKKLNAFLIKTSFVVLLILAFGNTLKAQDKIHKTDNTIIEAKVTDVNEEQIKYKKFSNQSGPIYSINISEVYMVVYENGDKEVYNAPKVIPVVPVTPVNEVKPTQTTTTTTTISATQTTSTSNTTTEKNEDSFNNKKVYFNIGSGFGLNAASREFDFNAVYDTINSEFESVNGSLGKGPNFGLGIGFVINKNMAFEISANYLKGTSITTTITENYSSPSVVKTNIRKASMLRLTPAFAIHTGEGTIKPYLRVGLILGFAGKMVSDYSETSISELVKKTEFTGRLAMGYASAIGLNFGQKNVSCFAEFGMVNLSWAPAKSTITEFTKGGIDQLTSLTTYEIETEYLDKTSSQSNSSPNNPAQKTKRYYPLSSFGLNVGIRILF